VKKICSKCKIEKDISFFTLNCKSKSGFRSECKNCEKTRRIEKANFLRQKKKEYREKNKERIKAYKKAYYQRKKNAKSSRT
jgi:hypothetical protein